MAWVSIHQQIRDHRKLRDLFRALDISRQEALGTLVLIWTWALDNCDKEGKLLSVNKHDLAHAAYWEGDPDKLCNALIKTGWIDIDGKGMYIHDWYDFNKPFYDYTDRKAKDRERKRLSNSAGNSVEIPLESRKEFRVSPAPAPAPAHEHKKKKNIYAENSDEFQLALFLHNEILKNNPEAKEPNMQTWALHIDYMIRIDNRKPDQIKQMITYAQSNSFWIPNILSTAKLREKFDTLWLQRNLPKKVSESNKKDKKFEEREYQEEDIDDLYYDPMKEG